MKNEIIILEKIENKLKENKKLNVFPLSPTHRKELREIKNSNIQNLRRRLNNIKSLKFEEFIKNNENKINKIKQKYKINVGKLNKEFNNLQKQTYKINKIFLNVYNENKNEIIEFNSYNDKFKELGNLTETEFINKYLKVRNTNHEVFYINENNIKKEIQKEFNIKFNEKFKDFIDYLDLLEENYKESIVFGDLESCKELYYKLKECDKQLNELSELKI